MTRQHIANTKVLIFVAALACNLPCAHGADEGVRAEVQHVVVNLASSPSEGFDYYQLKFDLRLTNRSLEPVYIPTQGTSQVDMPRVVTLSEQVQERDGTWTYVGQGAFYGMKHFKYDTCVPLSPGSTTDIHAVASGFALERRKWASKGRDLSMRLGLIMLCRKDGQLTGPEVRTEAFTIRLPDRSQ
jgi:hypothetical protein